MLFICSCILRRREHWDGFHAPLRLEGDFFFKEDEANKQLEEAMGLIPLPKLEGGMPLGGIV